MAYQKMSTPTADSTSSSPTFSISSTSTSGNKDGGGRAVDFDGDKESYDDDGFLVRGRKQLTNIGKTIQEELKKETSYIIKGLQNMGSRMDEDFEESGDSDIKQIKILLKQHTNELKNMFHVMTEQITNRFKTMLETSNNTLYQENMDMISSFTTGLFPGDHHDMIPMLEDDMNENKTRKQSHKNIFSSFWSFIGLE